jgi:chemotaxis protein CheZ
MHVENVAALPPEDGRVAQAELLLEHLRAGREDEANAVLEELTNLRQTSLFQEVGKLTRALHDALTSFRSDSRLANLADQDIPDAKQRLNYVISMTDQAATKTLAAIEQSKPLCDDLARQAQALSGDWTRFMQRRMEVEEFRRLSQRLGEFLPLAEGNSHKIGAHLSDVLMAQAFQDLTGQIIRRVITLVEEVEQSLINMVRLSGQKVGGDTRTRVDLEGPQVPGIKSVDAVSGQDEVDDLLSSLGF